MLTLKINDKLHTVDASPDTPLLWVLGDLLGFNGTNFSSGGARRFA
jgi:isoquinoline 1-oxidoreductase subunit alpha